MFKKINTITDTITKTLKLPLWHKSEIKCEKIKMLAVMTHFFHLKKNFVV